MFNCGARTSLHIKVLCSFKGRAEVSWLKGLNVGISKESMHGKQMWFPRCFLCEILYEYQISLSSIELNLFTQDPWVLSYDTHTHKNSICGFLPNESMFLNESAEWMFHWFTHIKHVHLKSTLTLTDWCMASSKYHKKRSVL